MKANILILHNYDGFFAGAFIGTKEHHVTSMMDIGFMLEWFKLNGFHAEARSFARLDLSRDYSGWYVLYASSEERGLFYKGYIEDIILWLQEQKAVLIPSFPYFRAHHNKCFAEMLRASFVDKSLRVPVSRCFGHYKELLDNENNYEYPCIIKVSAGSGSVGVQIANSKEELLSIAKKFSRISYSDIQSSWYKSNKLFRYVRAVFRIFSGKASLKQYTQVLQSGKPYVIQDVGPLMSNKFIVGQFIPNLSGDFKVLYFGEKYYILRRENRNRDFRASGSGNFSYPDDIKSVEPILECAKRAVEEIKMPMCSLDIAMNDKGVYLLEYQCLYFGPFTIQYAPYHTVYDAKAGVWVKIEGASVLEEEYCRSVSLYIQGKLPF